MTAQRPKTQAGDTDFRNRENRRQEHVFEDSHGRPFVSRLILIVTSVFTAMSDSSIQGADVLTVMDVRKQENKWDEWSLKKLQLTISGRYEGRVAKQFRLARFPALITPERTTVLPLGVRGGQRLTVTGVLRKSGTKYFFDAARISAGSTDLERLDARVKGIDETMPQLFYELADEYQPIAEFYDDDDIKIRLRQLRTNAFELQRKQAADNPAELIRLADSGAALGVPERELAAIRFQSLVVRFKQRDSDREVLLADIRKLLKGWDTRNPFPTVAAESAFLKNMQPEYEKAAQLDRERMHRRLYRLIKSQEIIEQVKPDGSNGKEVATALLSELPEEREEAVRLQTLYVNFRLKKVPELRRTQLEDIDRLLKESGKANQFKGTLDEWLEAQDQRLNDGQLDNILLLANHYLFAFDRWKYLEHRDKGIDLLKTAWASASKLLPKDAAEIEKRLEAFGWQRMHNKWMTAEQVRNLPRDDIELATKERRAVVGMKSENIIRALGEPDRRIRIVSSNQVQEIWVYGEADSIVITVHMRRGRLESAEDAIATRISRPGR